MRNALLVVSGVAIGLLGALVALASGRSPLPRAEAQAGPAGGGGAQAPTMVLGTGGGSNNLNDLCWVLSKVKPARGPERTVLSLYRAKRGGEFFDLEDVRMIDADVRIVEFKGDEHKKGGSEFQKILKLLPKEEQETILPPRNP